MSWTDTTRLGTELEVVADFDLAPLLEHLQPHVSVVRNSVDDGRSTLWLELVPGETSVDDAVVRYAKLVEALPPQIRSLWNEAADRCLNTGVQSGRAPHAYHVQLAASSMEREARIALRHVFTIYAAMSDDELTKLHKRTR